MTHTARTTSAPRPADSSERSADCPSPPARSRRDVLRALTAAGIGVPLAARLAAQAPAQLTPEAVRQAAAVLGDPLTAERLAIVERALQRNLDQFQIVRELVLDDLVEPAPMFSARTHAGPAGAGVVR